MVLIKILIYILIFSCLKAFPNDENMGEKNFTHYYGPTKPLLLINHYNQKIIFEEEYNEELYLNSKVQNELFNLEDFLKVEFSIGLYCPEVEYKQRKVYARYLTRLLVTSYLFESMRNYEYTSKQMGFKNSCEINWNSVFSSCKPKTQDMKTFITNTKHILKNLKEVVVPFEKTKKNEIQKWFKQFKDKKYENLTQFRLSVECKNNKCRNMNKHSLSKKLNHICSDDLELIENVCSENDSLLGQSYIPEIYPLLMRTMAMSSGENPEFNGGCLRRFMESNQLKESYIPQLKNIFSYLYSKNLENKSEYERGRLFSIGSLKEFHEKGLENIFEAKTIKKAEKVTKVKNKKVVEPRFEKIILPIFKKKNIKNRNSEASKKIIRKIEKVKKSTFLVASIFRRKFDYQKVKVDMKKFNYDYVFTMKQEKEFKPIVHKFSSQKSLKEMLNYDKLGSKKAPIPLRFLKFLIDKKMHQGLFNIVNVLGEEFYIRNDLDENIKKLEFIRIFNNKSTGFKWEIEIVKPILKK